MIKDNQHHEFLILLLYNRIKLSRNQLYFRSRMYKNPNKFYSTQSTNLLYIGKTVSIFKINYIKILLFSFKYSKQAT